MKISELFGEFYISRTRKYTGTYYYDDSEYLHKDFVWREDTIHIDHPFKRLGPNVYNAYFASQNEAEEFLDGYVRTLEADLRSAKDEVKRLKDWCDFYESHSSLNCEGKG